MLGCGHVSHLVKMLNFFKSYSLFLSIDQTYKYMVMMTKKGYTKTINFMVPRVVLQGFGHIGDEVKMLNFIKIFESL